GAAVQKKLASLLICARNADQNFPMIMWHRCFSLNPGLERVSEVFARRAAFLYRRRKLLSINGLTFAAPDSGWLWVAQRTTAANTNMSYPGGSVHNST